MRFKRDADLMHWKDGYDKKIAILKNYVIDGRNINNLEIRRYTHNCSFQKDHTVFSIFMEIDNSKIEARYNENIQRNDSNIESIAQCITNFNGVYSTINRLLLDLEN